jgi:hypothetical protein
MKSLAFAVTGVLAIVATAFACPNITSAALAFLWDPHTQPLLAIVTAVDPEAVKAELKRIADGVSDVGKRFDERFAEITNRLVDVEQKQIKASKGSGSSRSGSSVFAQAAEQIQAGLRGSHGITIELPISPRAALSNDSVNVQPQRIEPVLDYHPALTRLLELLPTRKATGNTIEFLKIRYATDSSDNTTGLLAAEVAELAEKPESKFNVELIQQTIPTFAHHVPTSKQILDDFAELQSALDTLLRGGLLDVIDTAVFNTLKAGGNYMPFNPSGTNVADNIARITALIAAAGGRNIVAAVNPDDMLEPRLVKAGGSGDYLGLPVGLPALIAECAVVTSGKLLAFAADGSGPVWGDREGITVVAGLSGDDFTHNVVRFLAETRGAAFVRDKKRVAYGDAHA